MQRLIALFGALLLISNSAFSQVSIQGPGCIVVGNTYTYTATGWNSRTSMQWCITGGTIAGSAQKCPTATPLPSIQVTWNSSNGSIALTTSIGNASFFVSGSTTLQGGAVSPFKQFITTNVPATITCTPATGGTCSSPSYSYQWQSTIDTTVSWSHISGATGLDLSFTAAPFKTTFYRRRVFESVSGITAYSNTSTVVVNVSTPLDPGAITSSHQSVTFETIPANINASAASGGSCAGAFQYQWQYSYDGNSFDDIDSAITDNLTFVETLDSNTYFRRQVVCGTDTAYTSPQMITVLQSLNAGSITTASQAINVNTVPPVISATAAANGDCGTYIYQWQQSTDGYTFTNISGATAQNYSSGSPLGVNTFYRRKTTCNIVNGYTNTIYITVKQVVIPPVVVKNEIDSLLDSAGVNIATLFNLFKDSTANNRGDVDTNLLDASNKDKIALQLTQINNQSGSTLEQADLDSLMLAPLQDSIEARLNAGSVGGTGVDTLPALPPFLDDNIIQLYRSTGNYDGLDSMVNLDPMIPIEEIYAVMADTTAAALRSSQASSRILPFFFPRPFLFWTRSAVINGPTIVVRNQTAQYIATFNFPVGNPPDIRWVVVGGTITSQNINPANGAIYVNVNWTSSFGTPYVAILDIASGQYQVLNIRFFGIQLACRAFPVSQLLYYGQVPSILNATVCNESGGDYSNYQWQVLDVYSGANWTDIAGATSPSYQPPGLTSAWLMYRRLTKVYSNVSGLIGTYASSAVSVRMQPLNPGNISAAVTQVQYNTVPAVTVTAPTGGYTTPGSFYSYTWESSTDGGATWTSIGTTANFPNFPITANMKIRRKVQVSNYAVPPYTLPSSFVLGISNEIRFTYYYVTVDFENRNYIRENAVLTRGIQTWESADALPIDKKSQQTTYLDGLSRPIQTVTKGTHYDETANQWYDHVQALTYEAGGRVEKTLLPYPSTENFGKFKNNVTVDQPAYYATKFGETHAYGRVDFDGSPLNKLTKLYSPGTSWGGSNVGVSQGPVPYNASENVKQFAIGYNSTDLPVLQGVYSSLFLLKNVNIDEQGRKVINYTDRIGNVILEKVQLADVANLSNQHQGWLCTYYVYNELGQLRYIISPKAVKELDANGWVLSQDIADELCSWFDYDDLGRVIAKKTPGSGVLYTVYDKRNRPVFAQDANQRAKSPDEWVATFYDDLNRPVLAGIYKSDNTRDQLQAAASTPNNLAAITTTNGGIINLWGCPLSAADVNNTSIFTQLTFKYYDNYSYAGVKTFNAAHTQNLAYRNAGAGGNVDDIALTARVTGFSTGKKNLVMDGAATPKYLVSTMFYDEETRSIQMQADNIKSGIEITSTQFHFDGRALSKSETHNGTGTAFTNFNILTKFKFDKLRRVVGIAKKINNSTRSYVSSPNVSFTEEDNDAGYKIISAVKYDELGRQIKKTLSPAGGTGGTPLETLDYSFNIRGWLTGINKDYALAEYGGNQWDHYFGIYLGYANVDGKFAASQKTGQITGALWKSQGDNTPRKFDYIYDNADRLLAANFTQRGSSAESWNATKVDFSTKNISYDENGNLLALTQTGILPGNSAPTTLDNLIYTYATRSNKLARVDDNGTSGTANGKQLDFKDGSNAAGTPDYTYDANGNLVVDNNKRVTSVAYSYMDKPELITVAPPSASTGGGTIRYVYEAGGIKSQKIVTENPSPVNGNQQRITTTSYIGAFIYEAVTVNGVTQPEVLQMIRHEEGRIRVITPYNNPADPANFVGGGVNLPDNKQGVFDYYICDNIGNIRTVITEEINKASSICTMETAVPAIQQYEEALFGNPTNNEVVNTRFSPKPPGWASNGTVKVSKLQSPDGTTTQTGPNVLLRVMAGDLVSAKADYYYLQNPGSSAAPSTTLNALLQTLVSAFSGNKATELAKAQASSINTLLSSTVPLQSLLNSQPNNGTTAAPRAYLNYIFLDEQFNFVSEGSSFVRVSQPGDGVSPLVAANIKAPKNGYAFVFLTNGSSEPVYFDNLTVSHERGRLIEENHMYAYGLKIAPLSSKAVSGTLNTKMVNSSYQGMFSEEVNELELNYHEFALRTYDPQIGRWTTTDPRNEFASPYVGMGMDPVNNIDPDGGSIGSALWSFFGGGVSRSTASALAQVACPGAGSGFTAAASNLVSVIRMTTVSLAIGGTVYQHAINKLVVGQISVSQSFAESPTVQGTAAPGAAPNGTSQGITEQLNNNLSASTGSEERITGHGPNANTDAVPVEDEPEPNSSWKEFYKADLETYSKTLGYTAPTDKDLGTIFEDIFYNWYSPTVGEKFKFRKSPKKIDDDENTIPDMVADNAWWRTVIVRNKYLPFIKREQRVGPIIRVEAAHIFECKATTKGVYTSSNDYQLWYHMFNLYERMLYTKSQKPDFETSVNLVTTWDVNWSPKNKFWALHWGLEYYHYRAMYRIVNGVYEFKFVKRSWDDD